MTRCWRCSGRPRGEKRFIMTQLFVLEMMLKLMGRWREMRSQLEVMLTRQQERRRRGEGRLEGPLCPVVFKPC